MASIERVYARASLSRYFVVTSTELLFFAFNVEKVANRVLREAKSVTAKETFAREVERLIQESPEFQAEVGLPIPDAIITHVQELLRLCREE